MKGLLPYCIVLLFSLSSGALADLATLHKECVYEGSTPRLNPSCSHQYLLKEGNNIYTVRQLQAKKLVELSESGNLTNLKSDGTCLQVETYDQCKSRLKRLALETDLNTRENILRNNTGRADMVPSEEQLKFSSDPEHKQPKAAILKDLYDASQKLKDQNAGAVLSGTKTLTKRPASLGDLLGVRDVDFNGKERAGDTLKNIGDFRFQKAKTFNVREVNEPISPAFDSKSGTIDIADQNSPDENLNKMAEGLEKRGKLKNQITADQKNMDNDAQTLKKIPYAEKGLTSRKAFIESMEDIYRAAHEAENRNTKSTNTKGEKVKLTSVGHSQDSDLPGKTKKPRGPAPASDDPYQSEIIRNKEVVQDYKGRDNQEIIESLKNLQTNDGF